MNIVGRTGIVMTGRQRSCTGATPGGGRDLYRGRISNRSPRLRQTLLAHADDDIVAIETDLLRT